jgi:hypothetical protein
MKLTTRLGVVLASLMIASLNMGSTALAGLPEFEKETDFKIFSTGAVTIFKSPSGSEVRCSVADTGSGEITVPGTKKAKNVLFVFKSCKSGSGECTTPGAFGGEIKTKTLEGELGYIEPGVAGAENVAFALFPASGETLAEYKCKENNEEKGCVVGELKKANVETETFDLLFEEAAGVQKLKSYEPTKGTSKKCELILKTGNIEEGDGLESSQLILTCPNMEKIKS